MKPYRLFALAAFACLVPNVLHAQSAPAAAAAQAETRLPHISVVSIGSGDPVVLIPGLASPRAVWDGVAPALARNHRVLLVQVNGFGGDDPGANAGEGVLAGIVADLSRYLADNRIERPAIVGHSMGGLVGMMLARDHGEQVGRLMIVDSLPFFGVLMGPTATVDQLRPVAANMRDTIRAATGDQPAPANMSNTPAGLARVAAWSNAANRAVVAQALYEDMTTDLRPDVATFGRVPVTVTYAVPNAAMAEMVHGLYRAAYAADPDAHLVPVADSYHFIMLDQPQAFAAALEAFLAAR